MIESAEQFRSLRESGAPNEYHRAAHDEASLEVWLDVVSGMPTMRFWVAQNKTIPVEVLEVLAKDPDSQVREMVARKRKLPESLQFKLATDFDSSVRSALACNRSLASLVREKLTKDEDELVREAARRHASDGIRR